MKKNFTLSFQPAYINKTSNGWYITFYQTNPKTGERKRFRQTFDINRIKDKKIRMARARQIVHEINLLLPHGYPFTSQITKEIHTPILEAIEMAHKVKSLTDRKRTKQMYASVCRIFISFLEKKKWQHLSIIDFGKKEAMKFMDWLVLDRGVGARTYNNYLIRIKALFNALVDREYIYGNPFSDIKKKPVPQKMRRVFTQEEKLIVASHIRKYYPWLYLTVLLQYYCYIRPTELRRIRFKHFNLQNGTIVLPPDVTKNKKWRHITIPSHEVHWFLKDNFTKWPLNYLVFGKSMLPNSTEECHHNKMNALHGKILKHLKQTGKLHNIENLTFYSWKDTGLTDSDASLYADMRQAGHQDPKITLIYKHEKPINEEIRNTSKRL